MDRFGLPLLSLRNIDKSMSSIVLTDSFKGEY